MCFHSKEEMEAYERRMARRYAKLQNPIGFVIMRDSQGKFQESYFTNVLEPQTIANTIRNLRAWHPGEQVVDLDQVNKKREALGESLVVEGYPAWADNRLEAGDGNVYVQERTHLPWFMVLPAPTGEAPPAETPDDSTEEEEEYDEEAEADAADFHDIPRGQWYAYVDPLAEIDFGKIEVGFLNLTAAQMQAEIQETLRQRMEEIAWYNSPWSVPDPYRDLVRSNEAIQRQAYKYAMTSPLPAINFEVA